MSQQPVTPIPPDLSARYSRTTAGRAWLTALPDLVRGRLEQWGLGIDLAPGGTPWHGRSALVVPVRQPDSSPAALKIAFPDDEARLERHALELWNGNEAVALLASDADTCSLLLERLDPARSIMSLPLPDALEIWGGLVPKLGLAPDDRPQWREFDHIAARAEQWSDDLPAEWEQLGRPFPRWLLEAALEVCQTRGAVGRRSGRDLLVHTDLHFRSVLARPAGYAAIDPRPMIREPEFAVAPVLWHRLKDLPLQDAEAGLRQRCADFGSAAGLDPEVARQWGIARAVADALEYVGKRDHQGRQARSLWVAAALTGRTLEGLPPAHALPEPEQETGAR